eukprot:1945461-Pleurochrysis_carterae.AAC.1
MAGEMLVTGGDAKVVQIWDLRHARQLENGSTVPTPAVCFKCTTIIYSIALTAMGEQPIVSPR